MMELFVIHAALTWCLVGLIWVIQVVHYPMLKNVGHENFIAYHERHMSLISWVVGPLMLAEIGSAVALLFLGEGSWIFLVSLGALFMVWASTVLLQIPLHHRLTLGYESSTIDRLVSTNFWRTAAWSMRGACLAVMLITKLRS